MPSLSELGLNLAELLGLKKKKEQEAAKKHIPYENQTLTKKVVLGRYHENIEVEVDEEGRVVHATPDNKTGYRYSPPRKRENSSK